MFQAPGTTATKSLEIVTPEWQYLDNDDYNFNEARVVPVKEQRRMGTQRGNKTTPQAPAIEVRAKGLPDGPIACRCRLWNFGSCQEKENPKHDGSATQLTMLRANVLIEVTENLAMFGPVLEDGYRYARLRCFITRGARVQCKKFHIAFYIDCVHLPSNITIPGPDDSNFAIADLVDSFPWTRSARMSISEKAMCPRMHDKTKKAKSKSNKNGSAMSDSQSSGSGQSPMQSSPKRLKRALETPGSAPGRVMGGGVGLLTPNTLPKGQRTSPSVGKRKDHMMGAPIVMQNNSLVLPPISVGGGGPNGAPLYGSYLDRPLRMSRFSLPGLEDDMLQQAAIADEGELANIESALGQGRRSSQFISSQYWYQNNTPYYMNQNSMVSNQQGNLSGSLNGSHMSSGNGMNASSPLPVSNHSPTYGGTLQTTFSMDFTNDLTQRRLSSSGQWGSAELQSRRISTADISRLSASPLSQHQPGRGPEWDALFEAHAKVVLLDKSSPDYATKKTAAMAEVLRAAELIEQKLQKR